MQIDKDAPEDGSSKLGYSGHLNLSPQDMGAGIGLNYNVNDNIAINTKLNVSLQGQIDQSIGVSYSFSQLYRAGVRFDREFKDLG